MKYGAVWMCICCILGHVCSGEVIRHNILIGTVSAYSTWTKKAVTEYQNAIKAEVLNATSGNDTVVFKTEVKTVYRDPLDSDVQRIQRVSRQLERWNFTAYIGPYDAMVAVATEKHNVPYLCTDLKVQNRDNFLSMQPDPGAIYRALNATITAYNLTSFALVFEPTADKTLFDSFIKSLVKEFKLIKLKPDSPTLQDDIQKAVLILREIDLRNIIILTSDPLVHAFLKQLGQLGVMAHPTTCIILNLGFENPIARTLRNLRTNVTAVTLLDTPPVGFSFSHRRLLEKALVHDSVGVVLRGTVSQGDGAGLHGTLLEKLTLSQDLFVMGTSGRVQFNMDRQRVEFTMGSYAYTDQGYQKVGDWFEGQNAEDSMFTWGDYAREKSNEIKTYLQQKTQRIVTILSVPYVALIDSHNTTTGNARYQGYAIDVISILAARLDFQYELYVVEDGNYGAVDENGEWNGMVADVLKGKADMTLAALDITTEREEVLDFTNPFMTRTMKVLIQAPQATSPFFQFLKPLSVGVWVMVVAAVVVISALFYLVEKFSQPISEDAEKVSLRESIWLIFAGFVQGDTEASATTYAGRILITFWWFFILILVSSYTANLAAFLTVTTIKLPIHDVASLYGQTEVEYGTLAGSSFETFFRKSKISPYRDMYDHMIAADSNVGSTAEGKARVREGGYAFILSSPTIDYATAHDCDLMGVGSGENSKGFGIAVPTGAPFLEAFDIELLGMADDGTLSKLEQEWWWPSVDCKRGNQKGAANLALLPINMVGVFVVLFGGMILAAIVSLGQNVVRFGKKFHKQRVIDKKSSATELNYGQYKSNSSTA